MKSLFECLKIVKDHRRAQGQRTAMAAFLEMIVLAGMSGHFGFRAILFRLNDHESYRSSPVLYPKYEARHNTQRQKYPLIIYSGIPQYSGF